MSDKIGVLVIKRWVQSTDQCWQLHEQRIPTANPHLIQPPSITYHQQETNLPSSSTQSATEGVGSNGATNEHVDTTSRISEEEHKKSEFRPPSTTYHQQETNLPSSSTQGASEGVSSNGATIDILSMGATNAHVGTTSRISEEEHIKSGSRPPSTSYHQQETNLPSSSTQSTSEGVSSNGATNAHVNTTYLMSEEEYEKRFYSDFAKLVERSVRGESDLFQKLSDVIAARRNQSQQSSNNCAPAVQSINNQSANSNIIGSKIDQHNNNTHESREANHYFQLPCSTKHAFEILEGRLLNDHKYREETKAELLRSHDYTKSLTGTVREVLRKLLTSDVAKVFSSFENPAGIRFKNTQLSQLLDDIIWEAYDGDEAEDVPPRYVILQAVSRILHEMTAGRRRKRVITLNFRHC